MTTPYTYLIQWDDGQKYIGSRFANGCHPDEFFTTGGYFTSSEHVKYKIQESGAPTIRLILAEWSTKKEAYDHETFLLECFDARNNPLFLNKHNNNFPLVIWDDPEMKGAPKEVSNRPEVKKKKSIGATKAHANPEVRLKRAAVDNDPEVKARRSAAATARWAREEERKKQSAAQIKFASSPEEREQRSIRAKDSWKNNLELRAKRAATDNDPSVKAKRSAAASARWEKSKE